MYKEQFTVMVSRAVVLEVTSKEPLTEDQRKELAFEVAVECSVDTESHSACSGILESIGVDGELAYHECDLVDEPTITSTPIS